MTYWSAKVDLDDEKGKVKQYTEYYHPDSDIACDALRHEPEVGQHQTDLEAHDACNVAIGVSWWNERDSDNTLRLTMALRYIATTLVNHCFTTPHCLYLPVQN